MGKVVVGRSLGEYGVNGEQHDSGEKAEKSFFCFHSKNNNSLQNRKHTWCHGMGHASPLRADPKLLKQLMSALAVGPTSLKRGVNEN